MTVHPAVAAYYEELAELQRRAAAAAEHARCPEAVGAIREAIGRRGRHMDAVAASLVLACALRRPWGARRPPAPS